MRRQSTEDDNKAGASSPARASEPVIHPRRAPTTNAATTVRGEARDAFADRSHDVAPGAGGASAPTGLPTTPATPRALNPFLPSAQTAVDSCWYTSAARTPQAPRKESSFINASRIEAADVEKYALEREGGVSDIVAQGEGGCAKVDVAQVGEEGDGIVGLIVEYEGNGCSEGDKVGDAIVDYFGSVEEMVRVARESEGLVGANDTRWKEGGNYGGDAGKEGDLTAGAGVSCDSENGAGGDTGKCEALVRGVVTSGGVVSKVITDGYCESKSGAELKDEGSAATEELYCGAANFASDVSTPGDRGGGVDEEGRHDVPDGGSEAGECAGRSFPERESTMEDESPLEPSVGKVEAVAHEVGEGGPDVIDGDNVDVKFEAVAHVVGEGGLDDAVVIRNSDGQEDALKAAGSGEEVIAHISRAPEIRRHDNLGRWVEDGSKGWWFVKKGYATMACPPIEFRWKSDVMSGRVAGPQWFVGEEYFSYESGSEKAPKLLRGTGEGGGPVQAATELTGEGGDMAKAEGGLMTSVRCDDDDDDSAEDKSDDSDAGKELSDRILAIKREPVTSLVLSPVAVPYSIPHLHGLHATAAEERRDELRVWCELQARGVNARGSAYIPPHRMPARWEGRRRPHQIEAEAARLELLQNSNKNLRAPGMKLHTKEAPGDPVAAPAKKEIETKVDESALHFSTRSPLSPASAGKLRRPGMVSVKPPRRLSAPPDAMQPARSLPRGSDGKFTARPSSTPLARPKPSQPPLRQLVPKPVKTSYTPTRALDVAPCAAGSIAKGKGAALSPAPSQAPRLTWIQQKVLEPAFLQLNKYQKASQKAMWETELEGITRMKALLDPPAAQIAGAAAG